MFGGLRSSDSGCVCSSERMEPDCKSAAAERQQEVVTVPSRGRAMSDSASLTSYADYPAGRPFINTRLPRSLRPARAFPESSSG
ncbi:hypothetical protein AOLI_G00325410, partial [Acnodon oligacanthus]